MITEAQAKEFTEGLGTVLKGSWQLIKNAREIGVPEALGMETSDWVREYLGGYVKLEKEELKQAALELKDEGYSTREAAEVLGVSKSRVAETVQDRTDDDIEVAETNSPNGEGVQDWTDQQKPHVSKNSGENEWYTPPSFIEAARRVMGSIDTDPASSEIANERVQAGTFYTVEDDGLTKPWTGNVWMNPPYAQPLIEEFATALVTRWKDSEISQACVLVNNATDTKWFQRLAKRAAFVCFPTSRIKFLDPEGNPTGSPLQGQAILYFGQNGETFSSEFQRFGMITRIVRVS